MKIGRYRRNGTIRYFAAVDGKSIDFDVIAESAKTPGKRETLQQALKAGTAAAFCAALPYFEDLVASSSADLPDVALPAEEPLEPPVQAGNIICIGLNYFAHAKETELELPKKPLLFAKTTNALSGHNRDIVIPRDATQMDYEAELAVIIGRTCRRVKASEALQHVAGYTCANDVSARDFQFGDGQWYRGKSADTFGPIGPWLATPSEIGDPHRLAIRCLLNGEIMQDSNTGKMIFKIPELIEYISSCITLSPGDVICTGTPPGVGFARKPPVYIKAGDRVEVEIEKIGTLANKVRNERA